MGKGGGFEGWSLERVQQHAAKHKLPPPEVIGKPVVQSASQAAEKPALVLQIGRRRGVPNKTENEASLILKCKYPGAVIQFEALTFLCDAAKYTPDFMVCQPGLPPVFYEVKGSFRREKDILRLKMAAAQKPYQFILMEKLKSGWQETHIRGMLDQT